MKPGPYPSLHRKWLPILLGVLLGALLSKYASADSPGQQPISRFLAPSEDFRLLREVEFNGGAIADVVAADASSLLILAGMPSGFSIFRLGCESGECRKFVSASYLAGLLGANAGVQDWSLRFDPATNLLVLLPRREGRLVVLDTTNAPRLKRYRLGLPAQFRPGAVAFLPGGGLLLSPRFSLPGASRGQMIIFSPEDSSLTPVQVKRSLSTILQLHPVDARHAVALGYFTANDPNASAMLASVGLSDGQVELWQGSSGVRLLAGAGALLGVVRPPATQVIPADRPAPTYELAVLDGNGRVAAGTEVVPIYSDPRALAITDDARYALLLVNREHHFPDLWLINMHSRVKRLVRNDVLFAGLMPGGRGFYLVPARKNTVCFYRLVPGSGRASR